MIRNYFKIAIRNLMKNPAYSFINIFGLAIGLCCSLLITLWVVDEYSFDQFHQNRNQLYQIYINHPGDRGILTGSPSPLPLVEEFKTNERDIKFVTVTNWGDNHLLAPVHHGDQRFMKLGYYVGEDFLKMFSFQLLKGNVETALRGPDGIVLTESTARAIFGDEEPMGKIIHVDNAVDVAVTGIIKDIPSNSTFQFECLLPFESYIASQSWVKNSLTDWDNNSFQIYIQLQEGADKGKVEDRVRDVIKKHSSRRDSQNEIMFHPMTYWRLHSQFQNGKVSGGAVEQVRMFSVIAIFILVIACINFMNLSTARSERRAREVGIRKTVGSKRKELILQFLGESILVATLAFVLALFITELSLPLYNNLVGKKLFIDYASPALWMVSAAVVLFTGLISGSYPALYLSSFNAVTVLKGKMQLGQAATPRKILVTLQFFFSLFLIIGTIVFNQQVEFGKNRSLGYDQENLLIIENQGDIQKNYKVLKDELIQGNLAVSVTKSNSPITNIFSYMGNVTWSGKRDDQRASIATIATEYDYVKTFGFNLLDGRDFSNQFNDSSSMLINKAFADYAGINNPVGEVITWDDKKHTIIGVVDNALMASAYQPIDPMMIIFSPDWFAYMTVRVPKSSDLSASMKEIESVFRKHNPSYPFSYRFADAEFQKKFGRIQLITHVANIFALLAIVISCLGLLGLAAYTAEQRTKEIGIRKVMGASVTGVVILLSKDFAKLILIAFVFAGPLAWWSLDSWLERYPYRIEIQWWTLAFAGMVTMVIALITVSSQALKAAISNPAQSLRSE